MPHSIRSADPGPEGRESSERRGGTLAPVPAEAAETAASQIGGSPSTPSRMDGVGIVTIVLGNCHRRHDSSAGFLNHPYERSER